MDGILNPMCERRCTKLFNLVCWNLLNGSIEQVRRRVKINFSLGKPFEYLEFPSSIFRRNLNFLNFLMVKIKAQDALHSALTFFLNVNIAALYQRNSVSLDYAFTKIFFKSKPMSLR